ncbi:MAG: DUF1801 domain-containing protein [Cyclobacteriaceae bacterium]
MEKHREVHPDFLKHLQYKEEELIELYLNLRAYLLSIHPQCNELLYHTHALTSLYSVSPKMSDAFCMIPIYTNHMNLGFNKGTLLKDPSQLLQGTGKSIRHIPINGSKDFQKPEVETLIREAIKLALNECDEPEMNQGMTISKIKS